MRMSDDLRDFDKKNETPRHKTDLADEITQALGINGVYVSVSLTNKEMHLNKLDFSEHDKVFEDKIAELQQRIRELIKEKDEYKRKCNNFGFENQELKQRIAELESRKTESLDKVPDSITIDGYKCKIINTESGLYISRDEIYSIIDKEKEPLKQKCKELEDRHQSDCIEINRLNTTIDVLIHKVEYLRQFAGLE